jgi:hypothetical protein
MTISAGCLGLAFGVFVGNLIFHTIIFKRKSWVPGLCVGLVAALLVIGCGLIGII